MGWNPPNIESDSMPRVGCAQYWSNYRAELGEGKTGGALIMYRWILREEDQRWERQSVHMRAGCYGHYELKNWKGAMQKVSDLRISTVIDVGTRSALWCAYGEHYESQNDRSDSIRLYNHAKVWRLLHCIAHYGFLDFHQETYFERLPLILERSMNRMVGSERCASINHSGSGCWMHVMASACFVVISLLWSRTDWMLAVVLLLITFALAEMNGYV